MDGRDFKCKKRKKKKKERKGKKEKGSSFVLRRGK